MSDHGTRMNHGIYTEGNGPAFLTLNHLKPHGSLIFLIVFNIGQRFGITAFLKVEGLSALGLFGPVDPSVCCGVTVSA